MPKPKKFRGAIQIHHMGPNEKATEQIGFRCPHCDKNIIAKFTRDDGESDDVTFIVEGHT